LQSVGEQRKRFFRVMKFGMHSNVPSNLQNITKKSEFQAGRSIETSFKYAETAEKKERIQHF
jgi:hypothetical protein